MNRIFKAIAKCSNHSRDVKLLVAPFARFLYTKESLGIDGYLQQRGRTVQQLSNISDKFREKMTEYTCPGANSMIFTEDLKNMVHLAEVPDLHLIKLMMQKFNGQNQELRFGSFVFGPVVLRMFHHLNKPNEALDCFLDASLAGFFDQIMTYHILLDLLYNNKMYTEVLTTYDVIKERQVDGKAFPRNVVVLVLAACYKENSAESLTKALRIWKDLGEAGHSPMRRAATFLAGLCLSQGKPEVALEIISSCNNQNYTTIRNIKVVALCQLGRTEDTLPILRSVLSQDQAYSDANRHTFNADVIQQLDAFFQKEESADVRAEYNSIRQQMDTLHLVADKTLEEQLCSEISTPPLAKQQNPAHRNQLFHNRIRNDNNESERVNRYRPANYTKQTRFSRPGLNDMQ